MIGILLLTQGHIGRAMIEAAEYMLGGKIPKLNALKASDVGGLHALIDRVNAESNVA